jgi:hypothetical protein
MDPSNFTGTLALSAHDLPAWNFNNRDAIRRVMIAFELRTSNF